MADALTAEQQTAEALTTPELRVGVNVPGVAEPDAPPPTAVPDRVFTITHNYNDMSRRRPPPPMPSNVVKPDEGKPPPPPGSPRKLILKTELPPGDVVCLTAVIRDLHRHYPGWFTTDVRTRHPDVWEHNPHVQHVADDDADATKIDCHYDHAVNQSNERGVHLMEGYAEDLAEKLGLPHIRLTRFAGDVHLSDAERGWMSIPHEKHGVQRYWVLHQASKNDYSVKRWPAEYFQAVVNHFRGKIQFVQVGHEDDHWHKNPKLKGVINLVGKTTLRQLIRTVHSASGVLSGISLPVHLAAAVPRPSWIKKERPCVVVAGGREPRNWYGYKTHTILDAVGKLECCATGGCWQSRIATLHDKELGDARLCHRVVNKYPLCQWMIKPADVIRAVESYLEEQSL